MRTALALAAGLLLSSQVMADGLKFPDPAEDAETIRFCASVRETPVAERMNCGDPVFETCQFDAAADAPNEEWRVVYGHCNERVGRAWDELMRLAYGELAAGAKARDLERSLSDAQRKWMAWRDAKCIWKEPVLHGNDALYGEIICMRDTTALRAIEMLDDLRFFR